MLVCTLLANGSRSHVQEPVVVVVVGVEVGIVFFSEVVVEFDTYVSPFVVFVEVALLIDSFIDELADRHLVVLVFA